MPGPPKTPTATLKLRGSWRAKTRPSEPVSELVRLQPPKWLSKAAKKHWDAIADTLAGMQVSTAADQGALAMLVEALTEYIEANKIVQREGMTTEGSTGSTVVHPAVKIRTNAWTRYMRAAREFGMTPSSRADAETVSKPETKNDKSRFFNAG